MFAERASLGSEYQSVRSPYRAVVEGASLARTSWECVVRNAITSAALSTLVDGCNCSGRAFVMSAAAADSLVMRSSNIVNVFFRHQS